MCVYLYYTNISYNYFSYKPYVHTYKHIHIFMYILYIKT